MPERDAEDRLLPSVLSCSVQEPPGNGWALRKAQKSVLVLCNGFRNTLGQELLRFVNVFGVNL